MKIARFGPAGKGELFHQKYKKTEETVSYLMDFGLNAYEYQCGRGVRINENAVKRLGAEAREQDIALSLHAPYYISLSSVEKEKRDKSVDYILESAKAADLMGADRIVVHSGSCSKMTRQEALLLASSTLKNALSALEEAHLSHITICPETMGKINQLGDFDEVMTLCEQDERLLPCIDFGHLYARTFGAVNGKEAFSKLLSEMENRLGNERGRNFHAHFSRIQFTEKGGEKCHLTFEDEAYGPEYHPLIQLIVENHLTPRIICESAGTQEIDAAAMKAAYEALGERR